MKHFLFALAAIMLSAISVSAETVLTGPVFSMSVPFDVKYVEEGSYTYTVDGDRVSIVGDWNGQPLNMEGRIEDITDAELERPQEILGQFPGYGFKSSSERIDPNFLQQAATDVERAYKVIFAFDDGRVRVDLVFVGTDGVHRGLVYLQGEEQVREMYMVGL